MNAFKSTLRAAMLAACAMAAPALAGQSTTTFEVYLDVANVCTLTKGGDVDFGRVAPTGTAQEHETSGSLVVRCTLPTAYSITLDQGLHGSGVSDRRMENGNGDAIAYRLYSGTSGVCGDWAGVQWGDGSGGSCVYSFTNHASDQTVQIKGKLTLSEAPAGSYSDTVTATITY